MHWAFPCMISTHDYQALHAENTITKFADDTTVSGLIIYNNEMPYWDHCWIWQLWIILSSTPRKWRRLWRISERSSDLSDHGQQTLSFITLVRASTSQRPSPGLITPLLTSAKHNTSTFIYPGENRTVTTHPQLLPIYCRPCSHLHHSFGMVWQLK